MGGVCVRQMKFPVAHSTTLVWNGLIEQAMTDGASYFLTCHDDTEFYPMTGKYWSDVLVGASRTEQCASSQPLNSVWVSSIDPHRTIHLCESGSTAAAEEACVQPPG
jgi:hypothetical protein